MELCPGLARFLRRLTGLTVGGALVLLLAKPIVIFLMTVAACATVGFLVWLPLHIVLFGRHRVLRGAWERGRRWGNRLETRLRAARSRCKGVKLKIGDAVEHYLHAVRDAVLEIACGSAVGILVAVAMDIGETQVAVGALLGAAAGAGVVLGRRRKSAS